MTVPVGPGQLYLIDTSAHARVGHQAIRNVIAGLIVGRRAKLSTVGSFNTGFTLLARGEFSIIIVNLALAGSLMPVLQPFAALYVLILASASPLLAKESERIYGLLTRLFKRLRRKKKKDKEVEEAEV